MNGCSNQANPLPRAKSCGLAEAPPARDAVALPVRHATAGKVTCLYPRPTGAMNDQRRKTVLALMEGSFDQPLSGDELAASVGLSKGAFHRAFKATFGVTPFRLLTQKRVEAAARLMLSSNLTLGTIAVDTGFYDQAHLCRQFRKVFGESPDRWRRRHRERRTSERASA